MDSIPVSGDVPSRVNLAWIEQVWLHVRDCAFMVIPPYPVFEFPGDSAGRRTQSADGSCILDSLSPKTFDGFLSRVTMDCIELHGLRHLQEGSSERILILTLDFFASKGTSLTTDRSLVTSQTVCRVISAPGGLP
jgi:hypothetical protein